MRDSDKLFTIGHLGILHEVFIICYQRFMVINLKVIFSNKRQSSAKTCFIAERLKVVCFEATIE